MKKLGLITSLIIATALSGFALPLGTVNGYGDSFIFDENGITFSVYPDGEFDFYIDPVVTSVCVNTPTGGFSFNSGYDYSPYVQYDDYGAVIQVENVEVYYDYYGRVSQIGNVPIQYRDRRVCQVGGLYVYYNHYGYFTHYTGFINIYNPYYVYRPSYVYFARPVVNLCLVSFNPYRAQYHPIRYTYYHAYTHHARPHYGTVGHTYAYGGHAVVSHYRQAARGNEVAFSRGQRKVTNTSASRTAIANRTRNNNGRLNNTATSQSRNRGIKNSSTKRPTDNTNRLANSNQRDRSTASRTSTIRNTTKPTTNARGNSANNGRVKPTSRTNSQSRTNVNSRPRTSTNRSTGSRANQSQNVNRNTSRSSGNNVANSSRSASTRPTSTKASSSQRQKSGRSSNVNRNSGSTRAKTTRSNAGSSSSKTRSAKRLH